MIVNASIFTCSICGEASSNICAYCTKDACSNHRCARCKRCSDCCECEVPLSAEEPVAAEAVTESIPELEPESLASEPPAMEAEPKWPVFLTAAESSVFVEGSLSAEPLDSPNFDESGDRDSSETRDADPSGPRE